MFLTRVKKKKRRQIDRRQITHIYYNYPEIIFYCLYYFIAVSTVFVTFQQSAFERASRFDILGKKYFPDGPLSCHSKVMQRAFKRHLLIHCSAQVAEPSQDSLDSAWVTFESLETGIQNATSMACRSVNKNRVGYRKTAFKPLLGFHCAYVKSAAMFLEFLKVRSTMRASTCCYAVTHRFLVL